MEFYRLQSKRFDEAGAVSIPNGMEFYIFSTFSVCPFSWVSIPNGMEFYALWFDAGAAP